MKKTLRLFCCLVLAVLTALAVTLANVDTQVSTCTLFYVRDTLQSAQGGALTAALVWALCAALYAKQLFTPRRWKRGERAKTVLLSLFFSLVLTLSAAYRQGDEALQNFLAYTHLMLLAVKLCGWLPLIFTALKLLLNRMDQPGAFKWRPMENRRRLFWLCFCAMLLCWLPGWLARYPGAVYADASRTLQHYYGEVLTTADHPYGYTIFLGFFTQLGLWLGSADLGVALFCWVQMTLLAYLLSLTLCDMARVGWPRGVRIAVLCLYCLLPLFSLYAPAVIKDSFYSTAFVGYMLVIWHAFEAPEQAVRRRSWWAGLLVFSLMLLLFRHNGKMVVWPMTGVLIVLFWNPAAPKRRAWHSALLAAPAAAALLFNAVIVPAHALAVDSTPDMLGVLMQQTARIVRDHGEDVSESERADLDRLMRYDELAANYQPTLSDRVRVQYRYFEEHSLSDRLACVQTMLRLGARHPLTAFHSFCALSGGYLDPLVDGTGYVVNMTYASSDKYCQTLSLEHPAWAVWLNERLTAAEAIWRELPPVKQLLPIGVYTWGLLLLFFLLGRRKERRLRWALLPLLMTLLAALLSPAYYSCTRYAFPLVFTLPYMAAMLGRKMLKEA